MERTVQYDLEKRTADFSRSVIYFVRKIKLNMINKPIISQLIRSATSIGANYCEADNAYSHSDFSHKISICKKESKETMYWLDLISETSEADKTEVLPLLNEVNQLHLIFSKILASAKKKSKKID